MRNERDSTSSFDLFLDTICNTFGGIVFLAILLAIMIQNRSVVKSPDTDGEHATPDQVRAAMVELESVTATHEMLMMTLAGMPDHSPRVDDAEYRERQAKQKKLKEEIEAKLRAEAEASKKLSETLEQNAVLREQNESIPKRLDEARKLVSKVRSDYATLVETKQQTLRVPRVQASRSASVLLLVQDNALYLARMPSLFKQGFNAAQVTTNSALDKGIEVMPINGTGWSFSAPTAKREFARIVREAKSDGNSITIAIWPESFDEFVKLRDKLVGENVLYQLWPQAAGEILKVYLGSGGGSNVQ